jgi:hypothetical protein
MIIAVWGKFDFKRKMRLFRNIKLCRKKLRNHHQIVIEYFTQSCKVAKSAKSSVYIRDVWRWQGRTRGAIGFA